MLFLSDVWCSELSPEYTGSIVLDACINLSTLNPLLTSEGIGRHDQESYHRGNKKECEYVFENFHNTILQQRLKKSKKLLKITVFLIRIEDFGV
jgi:hypothetical protein